MPTVLIVDDETLFRQSLADGLSVLDPELTVLTAENGRAACQVIAGAAVDLVLTDLQMPEMDGFELLAWLSRTRPDLPAVVMTAFGDAEISQRLRSLGLDGFIEKPADFDRLTELIRRYLYEPAHGVIRGMSLPTFLQAIEIDRKSCTVKVTSSLGEGTLHFVRGELHDAAIGDLGGLDAARAIVCAEQPVITLLPPRRSTQRRIRDPLNKVLLDSFHLLDEAARESEPPRPPSPTPPQHGAPAAGPITKELPMSIQEKLKDLTSLEGFGGVGIFTPTGEALGVYAPSSAFTKEIGVLANNVLLNAQKASLEMGAGRGQQVHVVGEKAHILVRCLNEGNDPLKSEPGKAHIHMVLVLENDNQIGLAKMRLNSAIANVAPELRG